MSRFQFFRTDQLWVRWRLLGGNNRVLGVSVRALGDHSAAMRELELVRQYAAGAKFEISHVRSGLWWWRMRPSVRGPELASSAHGFARRVDAMLSSRRFRQRAPQADVDLTLVDFQPGRRGVSAAVRRGIGEAVGSQPVHVPLQPSCGRSVLLVDRSSCSPFDDIGTGLAVQDADQREDDHGKDDKLTSRGTR
ncbi:MAG TPA: hypothetical protein VGM75_30810 [Pseudonocardiaceae bacterium]